MLRTTMLLSIIMIALTFGNASSSYATTPHQKPLTSWGYEEKNISFAEAVKRVEHLWASKVFFNKTNHIQTTVNSMHKVNKNQYDFIETQLKPGVKNNLRIDYTLSLLTKNKQLFLVLTNVDSTTSYRFVGLKNGGFSLKALKPQDSIFIVGYYRKNAQGLTVITQYFKSVAQGAEKLEYIEVPYKRVSFITPN